MPSTSAIYKRHSSDKGSVDGPQPMRNCKPSKMNPNSADHFRQTHQAEYEARGKRSTDHVERVHRHNDAYPVLRDELDRRRSTIRLTVNKARRSLSDVCSVCLKLRSKMRRNVLRSKRQRKRNRRYKTKENRHRLSRRNRETFKNKRLGRFISSTRFILSRKHKSGSDVGVVKDPSTAEPSISSYHSYSSLDQEPMVS